MNFRFENVESAVEHERLLQDACIDIATWYNRKVERELITRIEEVEGRVPTDDEVRQHGSAVIYEANRDITHYLWRGKPLFSIGKPEVGEDGRSLVVKWSAKRP